MLLAHLVHTKSLDAYGLYLLLKSFIIVDLQCHASFGCTAKWICYICVCVCVCVYPLFLKGFPGDSEVKNMSAMQNAWVQSLGSEDPLEKKMATHSSILAWRIPWTEKPGKLQSIGSQRVGHDCMINPLQNSFIPQKFEDITP